MPERSEGAEQAAEGAPPDGPPSSGAAAVLRLIDATKAFGAVHALEGVSLELHGGEVHALVGENGAGKSTLVKILGGVHQPDSGRLLAADGRELVLAGPADARDAGISIIFQEPTLFPTSRSRRTSSSPASP